MLVETIGGVVEIHVKAERDEVPVRGNARCSGDAALDAEAEDCILAELRRGNVWAWACVEVKAIIKGTEILTSAHLGCCSYDNRQQFLEGDYFKDMKKACLEQLQQEARKVAQGLNVIETYLNGGMN